MKVKNIVTIFLVLLSLSALTPSWGSPPPNPTDSDANGNTAGGTNVLLSNTGNNNTGFGSGALFSNNTGSGNTAIGIATLSSNETGNLNTAIGIAALDDLLTGNDNTAVGHLALNQTNGNDNTAVGHSALSSLLGASGNNNLALGYNAGLNLVAGNNNVYLVNNGVNNESNTIRIGTTSHSRTFIAGIRGKTVGANAVPVVIDSSGRLGTVVSSARFKKDIQDMNDASRKLLQLRPVTYRYKEADEDGKNPIEYGLIAEEVAKVYPDLVAFGADGKIETVQYQKLTPMLLNELQHVNKSLQAAQSEVQKQEQTIQLQAKEIANLILQAKKVTVLEQKVSLLQKQAETINVLTARLAKLEAHQMVGFNNKF